MFRFELFKQSENNRFFPFLFTRNSKRIKRSPDGSCLGRGVSETLCYICENSFLYFSSEARARRVGWASALPARQAPYFLIHARRSSPFLFIPRNAFSANPLVRATIFPVYARFSPSRRGVPAFAPDATAASQEEDKSLPHGSMHEGKIVFAYFVYENASLCAEGWPVFFFHSNLFPDSGLTSPLPAFSPPARRKTTMTAMYRTRISVAAFVVYHVQSANTKEKIRGFFYKDDDDEARSTSSKIVIWKIYRNDLTFCF